MKLLDISMKLLDMLYKVTTCGSTKPLNVVLQSRLMCFCKVTSCGSTKPLDFVLQSDLMWFCKVTSCGSINHQDCSIAFVIRVAKSCYTCRFVLQTWFCFCNLIWCIAASSKIFITYCLYVKNFSSPYIHPQSCYSFSFEPSSTSVFCFCRFLKVVLLFIVLQFFYQWSRGVWFWTPIIEFCFCPFCPFPFWGMICKFLLPFFVVFPFTATFCSCSLFRYFIQIACLFFLSWNFCRPSLSP